jgi:hypothetical protein
MAAVALLRKVAGAEISLPETEAESFVAESVSSCAAKTVLDGNVSVAERSGVVNHAFGIVEPLVFPPRQPFAAHGDAILRGYEKSGLVLCQH